MVSESLLPMAIALAKSGWRTPCDSRVRPPNPLRRMGNDGVISTEATPARSDSM